MCQLIQPHKPIMFHTLKQGNMKYATLPILASVATAGSNTGSEDPLALEITPVNLAQDTLPLSDKVKQAFSSVRHQVSRGDRLAHYLKVYTLKDGQRLWNAGCGRVSLDYFGSFNRGIAVTCSQVKGVLSCRLSTENNRQSPMCEALGPEWKAERQDHRETIENRNTVRCENQRRNKPSVKVNCDMTTLEESDTKRYVHAFFDCVDKKNGVVF